MIGVCDNSFSALKVKKKKNKRKRKRNKETDTQRGENTPKIW
jgi:hypothetical protein